MLQHSQAARWEWHGGRKEKAKDREYRAARAALTKLIAITNDMNVDPARLAACKGRIAEFERVILEYEGGVDRVLELQRNAELEAELARREQRLRAAEVSYWQAAAAYREVREQLVNQ